MPSPLRQPPHGSSGAIKIGSVLTHWNEPLDLIDLLEAFHRNQLPKRLMLSVNRINIPLGGGLSAWWDKQGQWTSFIPVKIPNSVFGCGSGRFYAADFRNMGYESLISNLRFEYNVSAGLREFSFEAAVRNLDMTTVHIEGAVPLRRPPLSLAHLLTVRPVLANVSVELNDGSYNQRKITYCAAKAGIPANQFVEDDLQRIAADLESRNLPPSPGLTNAVRQHLLKGTKLTININPFEPVGPGTVARLNRANFVKLLGLEVISGDRVVAEITRPVKIEIVTEATQAPKQRAESFNPVPVEKLGEHLGQLATIKTKKGVVTGYLERVEADEVILTQSLEGGSFTFVVKLMDIRKASIFY